MANRLDREFSFSSLLTFALPSVIMMIFTALYTVVDGMFISHFVGEEALAAVNIVFPVISLVTGVGIMLGTGGSAIVAHRMGAGDEPGARRGFTLLVITALALGVLFAVVGLTGAEGISRLLGSTPRTAVYCASYLRTLLLFAPAFMLQLLFQSFFVTAGRPGLGLGLTVAAGLTNAVLDYVFIVPCGLGILGAALATVSGYLVPSVVGLCFFALRKGGLRLARPVWEGRMLLRTCGNGSSEMVSNLAGAVVTFFFNFLMLRFLGEEGVAAITIVLYAQFLLNALYLGFAFGVSPVISFSHGAGNRPRLRRLFRICLTFVAVSSCAILIAALLLAGVLVEIFSPAGTHVYDLALRGLRLFSGAFLFAGLNIFTSAFFTALGDGRTSALISFLRTFGFLLTGLLVLPALLEVDGVWLAVPCAELLCAVVSVLFLRRGRRRFAGD